MITIIMMLSALFNMLPTQAMAQSDTGQVMKLREKLKVKPELGITVEVIVVDGDTIPAMNLPMVIIVEKRVFKNARDERKYWKLVRDIKKVMPFAKIVGVKLKEYEAILASTENELKKKVLMKKAEKELKKEFEGEIRNLTLNQGRILIKLIDRETGSTSYQLVKDLRGVFTAFLWQSVALIFATNLKSQYDAKGDDELIEEIIGKIEKGEL